MSGTDEITQETARVLVCLSASPSNRHVIRSAARMAAGLHASLTALYVGEPDPDNRQLAENIRYARSLNADIQLVKGNDIVFTIAEYARKNGVTDLFIGNSGPSGFLFPRRQISSQILKYLPETDIHIIPDVLATVPPQRPKDAFHIRWNLQDFFLLIVIMALATLLSVWFDRSRYSNANIITIYILAVLITSILTSDRIYGIMASILYILLFNFLFIDPRFTLLVYNPEYLMTYFVTIIAAIMTSSLAVRLKSIASQSAENAQQAKVLLDTSTSLQQAADDVEIIDVTCRQLVHLLRRNILYYGIENGKLKEPAVFTFEDLDEDSLNHQEEREAAQWSYENNHRSGIFTGSHADCSCQYLNIRTASRSFGVIGINMQKKEFSEFENTILLSIISECAMALEAEMTERERQKAEIIMQNERLRSNLLRSISHDLRTPLTSISGNASTLLKNAELLNEEEKNNIYADIEEDASWLRQQMENILAVTRLENSQYISLSVENVKDVIDESLRHVDRHISEHPLEVICSDDYLLAEMDSRMIIQVIINLVNNAIKYTEAGTKIQIKAEKTGDVIQVSVIDEGSGIPDQAKPHIFEAFYTGDRPNSDSRRSLGLGLNLCMNIIHAHHQNIEVLDNVPHGTIIRFTLSAREVIEHESDQDTGC